MKYVIVVFLVISSTYFNAQNLKDIDSLKTRLSLEKEPEQKMMLYADLARNHIYVDPNAAGAYNDSMAVIAKELDNKEFIIKGIYNGSVVEATLGNYDESLKLLAECIPYYKEQKDSLSLTQTYYQIGATYLRLDRNDEAIVSLNTALKFAEETRNDKMTVAILNATAIIYKQTEQTEKALAYFNKGIGIAAAAEDTASLAIVYNGAGVIYLKTDSLDKALDYFEHAMLFAERSNNVSGISYQHRNIGMVHQQRGEYEKAMDRHQKALEIRKSLGQKLNIGGSYSDLGEVNMSLKKYKVAEEYYMQALDILDEMDALSSANYIHEQLGRLYKLTGDPEKSLEYFEKYYIIRDSLSNNELREKINDIEIKYETEKKEKDLILKESEIKLKDIRIEEEKKKKNFYGLLSILSLASLVLFYYSYRQSRKRKNQEILTLKREHQIKSLESLLEGEEKERQRIAIELHDGVNGDLSALKYKLSSLAETNNRVITEAIKMIDSSCEQVRALSHNLTPPSFEKYTLKEVIENFCEILNGSQKEVQIEFATIGDYQRMSKNDEIAIFRIVQELVTNSLKHAQAREITIQASYTNQQFQISVEDNGIGFNRKEITSDGIGLNNIDSRVDYLGGNLDFTSNSEGTSYVLEIDLK